VERTFVAALDIREDPGDLGLGGIWHTANHCDQRSRRLQSEADTGLGLGGLGLGRGSASVSIADRSRNRHRYRPRPRSYASSSSLNSSTPLSPLACLSFSSARSWTRRILPEMVLGRSQNSTHRMRLKGERRARANW